MLEMIPPELLSQRAIECKSYARALFHWEQYMRKTKSRNDDDLARLQEIYAQIDEPDGIEGISAQMHVVSTEGRVLEHKKAGRWHAAQNWYQMNLVEQPANVDLQKNLMECLKESGQHDLLLDRFAGLRERAASTLPQLTPYAVEAAWSTFRWDELSSVLGKNSTEDFTSHLGQVMLGFHQKDDMKAQELMLELYKTTAAELTPNAITSLQNCHDTLLRLQVLDDIRILSSTAIDGRAATSSILDKRLDILGSNVQDKQYLL
ncbi:MAG: serine/threonine-protein kinase M1, partial [Watsoniomyces obsoletus]